MLVTQRDGSLHENVSGRASMGDQRTFGALQRAVAAAVHAARALGMSDAEIAAWLAP